MILKLLLVISMVATMLGAIAPLMSESANKTRIHQVNKHLLTAELQNKTADNSFR